MLRQYASLQFSKTESSMRPSSDNFSNTVSGVSDVNGDTYSNCFLPKRQYDRIKPSATSPMSTTTAPGVSSHTLNSNTTVSSHDSRNFFDSNVNTRYGFNMSGVEQRTYQCKQNASVPSVMENHGGMNPSVELPLMASFPQSEMNGLGSFDLSKNRPHHDTEPSSFLRHRVENIQQKLPQRITPDVTRKTQQQTSSDYPLLESVPFKSTLCENFLSTNASTVSSQLSDPNHITPPINARAKLATIQDKIVRFEGQLHYETQQKKAVEENRLQVLRESISTVEKTLNAEVRRRLETVKTIQTNLEAELEGFHSHVERTLEEKQRQITEGIDSLISRLHAAEKRVESLQESQGSSLVKLTEDIEQATLHIRTLKDHLENELKARRQREAILLDRLADVEKQLESRIALERGMRDKDISQMKSTLETIHDNHVALDDAFQQSLASTFHELKTSLQQESQAREQADDDIVQALNHYTAALQSALSISSST